MHRVTTYPLGNADSCLITLSNGKKILFDYGAMRNPNDKNDKRIDLAKALGDDLSTAKKEGYDVVAFTHLDNDHTHGAEDFFYFDHADKYKTKGRKKIATLWVPAAVITESCNELEPSSCVIQAEARHRLRKGYGIRVFSRPESLGDWLNKEKLTLDSRKDFITDAGNLAPDFNLQSDGIEFFVHSPFGWRQDDTVLDRNRDSLVMQAVFVVNGHSTKMLLGSDVDYKALTDIVVTTRRHKREARLEWDIVKLPHHCSYKTLSDKRGDDVTIPVEDVKWLFEKQGQHGCYIISSSFPIPIKGTEADRSDQPPHRQAATYYSNLAKDKGGEFKVTMQYPSEESPEPVEIEISNSGARIIRTSSNAPSKNGLAKAVAAARGGSTPPQQQVGFGR